MPSDAPATEVFVHDAGEEHLAVRGAALEVTRGPDKGKRVEICGAPIRVGSSESCDLILGDTAASALHFEIRVTERGFLLRDFDSTNGTFIGELRINEAVLPASVQIRVGRNHLSFGQSQDREEYPLSRRQRFGSLLGRSAAMRRVYALLERAVQSDATVLIEGESGTGKELCAQSLHDLSARGEQPFGVVDCGAVPEELIESELFGHAKGAFTGAVAARPGAFAAADGGTLFLDEIGELALSQQPKLLRFLEQRQVRAVGGTEPRDVDVRVVSATNRRLEQMVGEGTFRQDLFYRLAVVRVRLPALRERPEDVPLLALELARRVRPDADPMSWLDEATLGVLAAYHWPGNVRELRNVIERLAILPELEIEQVLGSAGPGEKVAATGTGQLVTLPYHEAKQRLLDAFERDYVTSLLDQEGGVVARAAERAGVPRQTLFRLINKHGLKRRCSE